MPVSTQVTLKQLRYFARIVELGSISRASHDLNVAQTALGLQVRALEDSLGATLLLRHPKGVEPTDLGSFVYEQSRQVLGSVDTLISEVQKRFDEKPRDIWLGLAPNFMAAIGTKALLTQAERIPDIRLHLFEGTRNVLVEALHSGELDWAIAHEAATLEGIVAVPLLRQSVALITRPGEGPESGEIQLRDVLSRDLVLDSGRRVVSGVLSAAAQSLGMTPNVRYQVDSARAIKDIIRSEGLSGLFIRSMVRDEIERGDLEAHCIVNPPLEMTAYFLHDEQNAPTERYRPALEFIDTLLDEHIRSYPVGEVRLGRAASVLAKGSGKAAPRSALPKVTSP